MLTLYAVTSSGGVATATPVASYAYDAWGNVEAVVKASADNNDIANRNPLRYRGYYYDTETELYYLQSRYYDPALYRFVNADRLASTGTGFLGYNMFAYANNNPVLFYDPTGEVVLTCAEFLAAGSVADALAAREQFGVNHSYVGRARPYVCYPGGNNSANCIGAAFNMNVYLNFSVPSSCTDVESVFGALSAQLDPNMPNSQLGWLGYKVRTLEKIDSPIYEDEYRIAMRITTPKNVNDPILPHFMYQTNTGRWAQKYGDLNESVLLPYGITPENAKWNDGTYTYDSDTLYIAVSPR